MTHVVLRHSYSSLDQFATCPKRYYHQRIIKDVVDEGGEASLHGNRVHTALEERTRDKTELPDYLQKHEPLVASIEALGGDLEAERELVLTQDLIPTTWDAEDAFLRSKLDILVRWPKRALILDWKTGKRRPKFYQLELSAMQLFLHYPMIDTIKTGFIWLRDDAMDTHTYKRDELAGMIERFRAKVTEIEQAVIDDVWPAKPSGLCGFCPAKDICTFAQKSYRRY